MENITQCNPWALQAPLVCKHLEPKRQTLNENEQGCYLDLLSYDKSGWKLELHETNTSMSRIPLKLITLFGTPTLTPYSSIASLDVHTREEQYLSLMYTMYTNVLNNTLSYTHVTS